VQALYGRGWQTFIANCGLKQFLGVGDIETAEYVEKLLGNATIKTRSQSSQGGISTSEARRPLLTAEEIMRLGAHEQIVLIGALKPLLITKTPFWEQSAVKGRALPNPYHVGTPRPSLRAAGADLQQTVMRILLWALAPHPSALLLYLIGLALWLGPVMGG
jgi:type IV secretion system protein VirD4